MGRDRCGGTGSLTRHWTTAALTLLSSFHQNRLSCLTSHSWMPLPTTSIQSIVGEKTSAMLVSSAFCSDSNNLVLLRILFGFIAAMYTFTTFRFMPHLSPHSQLELRQVTGNPSLPCSFLIPLEVELEILWSFRPLYASSLTCCDVLLCKSVLWFIRTYHDFS